ncbi:hypothetical protein [Prosthecomicrobium sp. N25]|uniref:hypothetical protein n=1 Tax=Prosthecomicrobium sp. N25 TaxID=3129254 RepID=UPI003077E9E0
MQDATQRHGPSRPDRLFEARDYLDPNVEPELDDILSDPVVRLVMRRDRLDPRAVGAFMRATAENLKDGRGPLPFVPAPGPVDGCIACR